MRARCCNRSARCVFEAPRAVCDVFLIARDVIERETARSGRCLAESGDRGSPLRVVTHQTSRRDVFGANICNLNITLKRLNCAFKTARRTTRIQVVMFVLSTSHQLKLHVVYMYMHNVRVCEASIICA